MPIFLELAKSDFVKGLVTVVLIAAATYVVEEAVKEVWKN